jgi:hypothetical protein
MRKWQDQTEYWHHKNSAAKAEQRRDKTDRNSGQDNEEITDKHNGFNFLPAGITTRT